MPLLLAVLLIHGWVTGMVLGKHICFFLDTGTSRSVLIKYASPLKKVSFPIVRVNGLPHTPDMTPPLYCNLGFNPSLILS
jgi:hypothetical protein